MSKNTDPENPHQSDDTELGAGTSLPNDNSEELSNFEKRMIQNEKDFREGKHHEKSSSKIPTRVKRETTEEEKNPEWKRNPLAIGGIIAILLVLGVMAATLIMGSENADAANTNTESQSTVSEDDSFTEYEEFSDNTEGAE